MPTSQKIHITAFCIHQKMALNQILSRFFTCRRLGARPPKSPAMLICNGHDGRATTSFPTLRIRLTRLTGSSCEDIGSREAESSVARRSQVCMFVYPPILRAVRQEANADKRGVPYLQTRSTSSERQRPAPRRRAEGITQGSGGTSVEHVQDRHIRSVSAAQ